MTHPLPHFHHHTERSSRPTSSSQVDDPAQYDSVSTLPPVKLVPYYKFSWKHMSVPKRKLAFILYSLCGYLFVIIAAPFLLLAALVVFLGFGLYRLAIPSRDALQDAENGQNSHPTDSNDAQQSNSRQSNKRKILYITSSGGGTHNSLVAAVRGYWKETHSNSEDDVEVEVAEAFTRVLRNYDIFPTLTWNTYTGEDLFNWLNARKANYIITCLFYVAQNHWLLMRWRMTKTVLQFYEEQQPSIVVSGVPVVSFLFAEAARQKNIPFILIPADADPIHYIKGMRNRAKDNPNLRVVIHHPIYGVNKRIKKIPENQRILCDYPVRTAFLKPSKYSVEELKSRWEVEEGTHPVGIFMGAGGSDGLMAYVKELCQSDLPLTLLPCCGRSEHLVEKLSAVKCAKNVHVKPIGYISSEEKMCEFFDVCEVVIMKPGPSCVREAIQRFKTGPRLLKKLLLDETSKVQPWEEDNVHQCMTLGIGIPVYNISNTGYILHRVFNGLLKEKHDLYVELPSLQPPTVIAQEMERMTSNAVSSGLELEQNPISANHQ